MPQNTAISELMEALNASDAEERGRARMQLVAQREAAFDSLLDIVRQQRGRACYGAALALQAIGDPRCLDVMVEVLPSPHPMLGYIALEMVQRFAPNRTTTILLDALPKSCPAFQLALIKAIGNVADEKVIPALVDMLRKTEFAAVRYTIIDTLSTIGAATPKTKENAILVEALQAGLNDEDHHVRVHAKAALDKLTSTKQRE